MPEALTATLGDPHSEDASMFRNPTTDLIVVLVIVLLVLGPKRLPSLGRSLGQGLREFKESISGENKHEDADRPALSTSPPAEPPPTSADSEPAPSPARDSAEVGTEPRS
jgi:sec-independent protein translocase protein TatA